ncbi:MAG: HisKA protein [Patescibacteria group bacterium]|nr:HisKA protein [Patescibacteria group bacterium]MDQ5970283.1 HisKA protein [Patescibacteria group bacterium]
MGQFFTIQNLVLFIVALVNLGMSIFVVKRGTKSKINLYFALLTFFNLTWVIGLMMANSINGLNWIDFYDRSTNLSGVGIIISLFYFTLHFPYQRERIGNVKTKIIWSLAILLSILIYTKWFIVSTVWSDKFPYYIAYYYKPVFIVYAIYFFVLAIWSIYFLIAKYKKSEGLIKQQLKWLIIAIIIGLIFGAYFNIIVSYFGNFNPGWLGPVFTLFMNIVVFRAIRSPKEKING